jgi:arginyl-tRNA synthetase
LTDDIKSSYSVAKEQVREALSNALEAAGLPSSGFIIEEPPRKDYGDFSSSIAFEISRLVRKHPGEVAKRISAAINLKADSFISSYEALDSGYLNFRLARAKYTAATLSPILLGGPPISQVKKNISITVEHSSVNPNKALHVGHLRNVVLGDTVARICARTGGSVRVLNYIDDSGLQIADLIVGFKFLNFDHNPKEVKFDHYSGDQVYVQVQREYEKNPQLVLKRREILRELEDEDSETSKLSRELTNRILLEQLKTCWRIGSSYDCLVFESDILAEKIWDKVFEKLKQKHTIKFETEGKNAGCWIADVPGEESEKVIVRSDGTLTYIGKDIPFAAWKLGLIEDTFGYKIYLRQPSGRVLWRTLGGKAKESQEEAQDHPKFSGSEVVINVIGSEQSRLQFIIERLLSEHSEKSLSKNYIHLGYAMVSLTPKTAKELGIENLDPTRQEIKMVGRKGIYVNADDILDKLKIKAFAEAKKRSPDFNQKELDAIAEQVGIAAIRFELLSQDLNKTILFDAERALQLEGETGPYLQYAYARASRIIEKYGESLKIPGSGFDHILSDVEFDLTKQISKLDNTIIESLDNLAPKLLAKYSYRLAYLFNTFYEKLPVIGEQNIEARRERAFLVEGFRKTLREALNILGIPTPERI